MAHVLEHAHRGDAVVGLRLRQIAVVAQAMVDATTQPALVDQAVDMCVLVLRQGDAIGTHTVVSRPPTAAGRPSQHRCRGSARPRAASASCRCDRAWRPARLRASCAGRASRRTSRPCARRARGRRTRPTRRSGTGSARHRHAPGGGPASERRARCRATTGWARPHRRRAARRPRSARPRASGRAYCRRCRGGLPRSLAPRGRSGRWRCGPGAPLMQPQRDAAVAAADTPPAGQQHRQGHALRRQAFFQGSFDCLHRVTSRGNRAVENGKPIAAQQAAWGV